MLAATLSLHLPAALANLGASPVAADADDPARAPSPRDPSPPRQALDDAWWTGPVVANSPATLPKGQGYVESYLYDVRSAAGDAFGSQTYLLYGLGDRLTAGVRPSFGYARPDVGEASAHVGVGDLLLHAHYGLRDGDGGRSAAVAIAAEVSLPTGRHDRLERASDGFGSGAYTWTLALYAQRYFWLGNGRLLRGRVNVGGSFSDRAAVRDRSVYGTVDGFRGDARPGAAWFVDNAWEYSLTRNWVLSTDFYYRHDAPTEIRDAVGGETTRTPAFDTFAIVPAIEYNWSARVGVIVGARFVPARGHNARSVTPVAALSVLM